MALHEHSGEDRANSRHAASTEDHYLTPAMSPAGMNFLDFRKRIPMIPDRVPEVAVKERT